MALAPITFSGLATGLDSAGIIDQLLQLERIPVQRLQDRQQVYSTQASKYRTLETKLKKLQDAAGNLGNRDDVLTTKVASSDTSVFTATAASGSPAVGSTSVQVTSLATAEKTYSDAFAAKDTAGLFGTGTLNLQVGTDTAVDITVDATDTLESVASKINASGADLTAGLIFDGTSYRLRVTGNNTGTERAITFTETGTTLGLDNPANEVQAAADAVFSVDGFAMTRPTNSFSDAVPGVTLTLTGASPTAAADTLSVTRDPDAARENAQTFIDAYNDVMRSITAEFAYTGTPKGPESLSGDSTLRGIQMRMRTMVSSTVAGTTSPYNMLAQIGISSTTDGQLELDAGVFDAAIADDPSAVADLLAGDPATSVAGFMANLDSFIEETTRSGDGTIAIRIDALDGRKKDLDGQIDRLELRIIDTEGRLRQQFATLEQLVSGMQAQGNQILSALTGLGNA